MNTETPLIIYDEGPIRHIRFNEPKKLNAISNKQQERLIQAVKAADDSPGVRVIAFSGEGRAFCSGNDLTPADRTLPERYRKHMVDLEVGMGPQTLHEAITVIRNTLKPTVVLMHGYCLGAGYDYATSCDFLAATEDCRFGDPRVHRALWAAEGWSYKITRLVPQGWTTRISLMGEPMTGLEAREIGLVHKVYPPDVDLREAAREFLQGLAELPAESYAFIKRQILDGLDLSYEAALAHEPGGF